MVSNQSSPQSSNTAETSVSRNPFTNLQTLLKGKLPRINFGKPGENFWRWLTVASVLLNLVLIIGFVSLGNSLFKITGAFDPTAIEAAAKTMSIDQGASISTSVRVQDQVPITLQVPLKRNTTVTLAEPARIDGTSISIRSATLSIDAPASLTLPAGAQLPLAFDLAVDVDTTVPIDLTVPVDIPLAGTEVGDSLSAMQSVIAPYSSAMSELPGCWQMLLWGGECP